MKDWSKVSEDRIYDEIEKLERWIRENPGKFDGVTEKTAMIKHLNFELMQRYPSF